MRLNFSNNILEDDQSSAQYDPGSGYLTVTLTKENTGEQFKDLDLLAKLLAPRPAQNPNNPPTIEVLGTDVNDDDLVRRAQELTLNHQEFTEGNKEILQN